MNPYIALTDKAWFDYLSQRATDGRVDEVNFWSPKGVTPLKRFAPGEPVFFRLKKPYYKVAGYGFFAHHCVLSVQEAWDLFTWKNGHAHEVSFLQRIGGYRGVDLVDFGANPQPMGCTVLRDARFWPEEDWLPWGTAMGWAPNIVQGKTETDPARAEALLDRVARDALFAETSREWERGYELVDVDERRIVEARSVVREGQGAFRTRLLDAYGRRCAITGERTEPVLDAAHIQPYLGPRSNHVQNGLVLTKEFHTLFDAGYVTVTPELEVRVSPGLRDRWRNGRRYYEYDGRPLSVVPAPEAERPSQEALAWHAKRRFRA